ncbi:MAG: mobile mystery protein A, partial [Bacteroidota bacterium]
PVSGWLAAIRSALNMTQAQLGKKMGMSRQGVSKVEEREAEGSITLRSLRDAARALDMQLVYAIVPRSGTLEEYLQASAKALATQQILATNQQMRLEDQEVTEERLRLAIEAAARELVSTMDRKLWD